MRRAGPCSWSLWRGETKVEEGFRAHFAEAGVPLDITVRSLGRDVSRLPSVIEEIRRVEPDLVYTWGTSVTLGIAGRDPGLAEGPDDYPPMILDRPGPVHDGVAARALAHHQGVRPDGAGT